jgi:hypothetical protein
MGSTQLLSGEICFLALNIQFSFLSVGSRERFQRSLPTEKSGLPPGLVPTNKPPQQNQEGNFTMLKKLIIPSLAIASITTVALVVAAKPGQCRFCGECTVDTYVGPVPGVLAAGYCHSCVPG